MLTSGCSLAHRALYFDPIRLRTPHSVYGDLVTFETARGTVYTLYARAAAGMPTVVAFHGNGEDLAREARLVDLLATKGFGVLAVEYPGFGLARGQVASEGALYDAADHALHGLYGRLHVPPSQVELLGYSLGTGVAAEMAHRGHGTRMVLLAPYTSIPAVARRLSTALSDPSILPDRYDTLVKAPDISIPTLVVHGTLDPLIPFIMGEALVAAFPRATLLALPGVDHGVLGRGRLAVLGPIEAFLSGR